MERLADALHRFTSEVYGYIELIATLICGILHAATSFGALLVDAFALLLFGITSLFMNAAHAVIVVLEDFGAFLADIVDVYVITQNSLRSFFDGLGSVALATSSALVMGARCVLESVFAVVLNLTALLGWIGSLVKNTAILVGNSTMLLLQSIPWGISAILECLKNMLIAVLWFIYSLPAYLLYIVVTPFRSAYDGLAEIPMYTYTGLIIAAILAWFTKHAVQSFSCKRLFYAVIRKLRQALSRTGRRTVTDSLNSSVEHQEFEAEGAPSVSRKEDSPQTVMRQLETERNEKLCVVCQDEPKCVILLPCRHLCLCRHCQSILLHTDPACPVCRRRIAETLHVFI